MCHFQVAGLKGQCAILQAFLLAIVEARVDMELSGGTGLEYSAAAWCWLP